MYTQCCMGKLSFILFHMKNVIISILEKKKSRVLERNFVMISCCCYTLVGAMRVHRRDREGST